MNPFPWGLLTLILLALDLLLNVILLLRKPVIKKMCRKQLAKGNVQAVANLMHMAEKQRLLKPKEYMAWMKEFDLEEYG
jgi:hypothetical protein